MHLIPCSPPPGALESAPATSLGGCLRGEAWEGFWHLPDERYYARLTRGDGSSSWFRFADEATPTPARRERQARVLPLRRGGMFAHLSRHTIMVGARRGTRLMLVGASRRGRTAPAVAREGRP